MVYRFQSLILFLAVCFVMLPACAQKHQASSLNIGDSAPPLHVRRWMKGTPVQGFQKGSVYVVDFWATWCGPCLASMSYTSSLAKKYRNKVTFIAIAVWERPSNGAPALSMKQIKAFVDSMGLQMDFPVAIDDSNFMANHWVKASGENAIPSDFLVNAEGKVAWIGNPSELDTILSKVITQTWNIKEARHKRISDQHWRELDFKAAMLLSKRSYNLNEYQRAVSNFSAIQRMIQKEPRLKYAPYISYITFWALLKINQQRAYEYGRKLMVTPTYQSPAYESIIQSIISPPANVELLPENYQLGAEAYQKKIDNTSPIYWRLINISEIYRRIATWYLLAHDTLKAREATQKAIDWGKPIKSPQ